MDELRVTRREENALILTNDLGEEFRFVVDDVAASEFRQLTKRSTSTSTVRPREIQALLRAGKTRAEVAEHTGLDEADVERFEEPVRAEQRYMLELARAVPVRPDASNDPAEKANDQRFGDVIIERLIGLGSTEHTWRSWRDEDTGWLIGLQFQSRDVDHDAIWTFEHRKRILSPLSPDAIHLSKAGDVGDQLIPKLRAVDNEQVPSPEKDESGFSADTFDGAAESPRDSETSGRDHAAKNLGSPEPGVTDEPPVDSDAEYERRREIDELAISKPVDSGEDLSQTADLLDALRKRRGERAAQSESFTPPSNDAQSTLSDAVLGQSSPPAKRPSAATNIWGASGVSASTPEPEQQPSDLPTLNVPAEHSPSDTSSHASDSKQAPPTTVSDISETQPEDDATGVPAQETPRATKPSKRGRSSIPSWDDILFGTRSDDDPA